MYPNCRPDVTHMLLQGYILKVSLALTGDTHISLIYPTQLTNIWYTSHIHFIYIWRRSRCVHTDNAFIEGHWITRSEMEIEWANHKEAVSRIWASIQCAAIASTLPWCGHPISNQEAAISSKHWWPRPDCILIATSKRCWHRQQRQWRRDRVCLRCLSIVFEMLANYVREVNDMCVKG